MKKKKSKSRREFTADILDYLVPIWKKAMKQKKLTQKDMAIEIGITREQVSNIMRGRCKTSRPDTIKKINNLLKV